MKLTNEELIEMYRLLLLTRKNDERINEIYARKGLPELPHSCMGEEAIAVGCTYKLRQDDYIIPSLRARGMFLVKGIPTKVMMAGAYGKRTGPARSLSTSHHMGDVSKGVMIGTGLIGSSLAVATGAALGLKDMGKDTVFVISFGDGASSQGDFYESLNLAVIWKLPVIFVCENNGYAISTTTARQMGVENVADKATGLGVPAVIVDGNDVMAVFEATQEAVARARKGEGPTLVECKTNRWRGHSENDRDAYRNSAEVEAMQRDCCVTRFEKHLLEKGILTPTLAAEIMQSVAQEIDEAVKFAEESPFPAPEEALRHVYAD